MKKSLLTIIGILSLPVLFSCQEKFEYSKTVVPASQIESNLEVYGINPGSNKLVLVNNNKGIGGMWDYNVGVSNRQRDTVIVPFLGEQVIKFYATCDTEIVQVEKKVSVSKIEFASDPLWTKVAGTTADGITWKWNTTLENSGCYGAGGYGWSPVYPDWNSVSEGKGDWSDVEVYPDEYIKLDMNGGANVTFYKHGGGTEKGSFSVSSAIAEEKAAIGWLGTITFRGATVPSPYTYYGNTPEGPTFEIAKLTATEMVLVQADADQAGIFCDPNWASASTHWCFKAE